MGLLKSIILGAAAGAIASWVKGEVETPLQKIGEDYFPPTQRELELKGADVTNRPEKMPPAVLADKYHFYTTGEHLTTEQRKEALPYIHYGLGMFIGVVYFEVVNRYEFLALDGGILAGAGIWSFTHGSTVPALNLQGEVKDMPKSWWVWEFGSHLVFGVAIEQLRRLSNKL